MQFPVQQDSRISFLELAWPVGSVFISAIDTNPAILLGIGTWQSFGAGRVLVGQDSGQSEFNVLEEVGGSKTHTLTEAEIPAHTHLTQRYPTATGGNSGFTVDTSMSGTLTDNTLPVKSAGGDQPHNNLQPYIVVKFWKRIA
jgi:hypothetical protein